MEQTTSIIKGGAFLIEDVETNRVFTPEDFTDEQKMIAQTTQDYVTNEVLPVVENLEHHEFEHSVRLLKKAGELGLLAALMYRPQEAQPYDSAHPSPREMSSL